MTTQQEVKDFLAQGRLAVVGVSRNPKKFGSYAYRELKVRGYRLFPVNRNIESLEGERCYSNLASLPEPVEGVLIVVPPAETEQVVREAAEAGIHRVWMQQGSESPAAIQFCQTHGIQVVSGECILMFAEPVRSFHSAHRWFWRLLGKMPKAETRRAA